jgi:hypothetical protein
MTHFTNKGDNPGQQAGKVYGGMHQHISYQAPPPAGPVYSPYAPPHPDDPLVGRDALLEQDAATRLNLGEPQIAQARRPSGGFFSGLFRRKPQPLRPVSAQVIIELSYRVLPARARQLFVRLAAFQPDPLSFDPLSAATINETSEATTRETLRLLAGSSLLFAEEGRYRLHRVLRDWSEAPLPAGCQRGKFDAFDGRASPRPEAVAGLAAGSGDQ